AAREPASLLGQDVIVGEGGLEARDDQRFGTAVHLGDEVDAALVVNLVNLPEVLLEEPARLAGDLHPDREPPGSAHAGAAPPPPRGRRPPPPPRGPRRWRFARPRSRRGPPPRPPVGPDTEARRDARRCRRARAAPRASPARAARPCA